MSDGHAGAVQPQPLGELTAGRTLEDTPLNPEWRRGVGANIHQAHFSATRQTLHWLSHNPYRADKFSAPKCVQNVLLGPGLFVRGDIWCGVHQQSGEYGLGKPAAPPPHLHSSRRPRRPQVVARVSRTTVSPAELARLADA